MTLNFEIVLSVLCLEVDSSTKNDAINTSLATALSRGVKNLILKHEKNKELK